MVIVRQGEEDHFWGGVWGAVLGWCALLSVTCLALLVREYLDWISVLIGVKLLRGCIVSQYSQTQALRSDLASDVLLTWASLGGPGLPACLPLACFPGSGCFCCSSTRCCRNSKQVLEMIDIFSFLCPLCLFEILHQHGQGSVCCFGREEVENQWHDYRFDHLSFLGKM